MALTSIYSKYFQKSKVFLYPLLGVKRGMSVVPKETYVAWDKHCTSDEMKLICVYDYRTDDEYKKIEKNILLEHDRLSDYVKVKSEVIFTFDFSDLDDDWFHFINGRYSLFSPSVKQKILGFFDKYGGNYAYIHSYLIPEKYYDNYAELLDVDSKILKEVKELCSKPDLDKETLMIEVADLNNLEEENNLLNLSKTDNKDEK
jgi:hypothetical protein